MLAFLPRLLQPAVYLYSKTETIPEDDKIRNLSLPQPIAGFTTLASVYVALDLGKWLSYAYFAGRGTGGYVSTSSCSGSCTAGRASRSTTICSGATGTAARGAAEVGTGFERRLRDLSGSCVR
jgi:hypothetical protein